LSFFWNKFDYFLKSSTLLRVILSYKHEIFSNHAFANKLYLLKSKLGMFEFLLFWQTLTPTLCLKQGSQNSNWLEGHILKKKCSAGRSFMEKSLCGPQIAKNANFKYMPNLIKIYNFIRFWDFLGPHKYIW
jgi:hypothetical protein